MMLGRSVTAFRGSKFGYSMFVQNSDCNSRTGEQFEVCTRPRMRAPTCARACARVCTARTIAAGKVSLLS